MNNMTWNFGDIWNQSLEAGRPKRELEPRERIWAGEVGGAYIDRYLKMNAVKPSNPPNNRSNRKFEAGNLMEWIVGMVLKRAGILLESQTWLEHQYPGLLRVTGKLDFKAGGKPDWDKANSEVKALGLPDFFGRAIKAIVRHLREKYPDGLKEIIPEIKSCSSFMYGKYEVKGADKRHQAQLFHYLKAKGMSEGHVVYICKDDLRMLEYLVLNPSGVEDYYKKDIEQMTYYINSKTKPEKEKEIIFEDGRFSKNFKIAYSSYLTMLYGYKDQFEFDEKYEKIISSWNRILKRCVDESKMTKLNLEVIDEIKKTFPNFDELVVIAKESKNLSEEIPEEE